MCPFSARRIRRRGPEDRQGQSSRRERVFEWRGERDKEDLGTGVIGSGRWR